MTVKIEPDKTLQRNLMAFGWECDKGWYPLIQELIDRLNILFPTDEIEVLQVKEKYAGLRFYVCGASERADKLISLYEEYSYHICEYCGEFWTAKERVNRGWYKTLCDKHSKKWLNGTLYESGWKKFWRLFFYRTQLKIKGLIK